MKVISLLQPWASLVVMGHKKIETRSWNTKYRGEILIHASGGKKSDYRSIMLDFQQEFFNLELPKYESLPFGAIIGKVTLLDTFPFDAVRGMIENNMGCYIGRNIVDFSEKELAFGDYSPNRYGWLLSDPVLFEKPTPAKGQLSIWNFDESLLIK